MAVFGRFPGGVVVKNPPASAADTRDAGSTPGLGRSLGDGNGKALQCSCLGDPMDRGTWRATVHGVTRVAWATELKHTYKSLAVVRSRRRYSQQARSLLKLSVFRAKGRSEETHRWCVSYMIV